MKRAIVSILLLLGLLFGRRCAAAHTRANASNNLAFYLDISDKFLKINNSTHVSVRVDTDDKSEFTYEWTTTIGSIEGTGNEIKYTAPDSVGSAMITVTIRDESGNPVYRESVSMSIYKQFVILKADDLVDDGDNVISPRWQTFIDYVEERNIKASIGIIGYSLEGENDEYFSLIRTHYNRGNIEFWNHGYNHLSNAVNEDGEIYHEFWNSPYEYQKEHLLRTQTLFKKKLNITSHTFGAPGNAVDSNTVRAIEEIDDIEVWLFGDTCSTKFALERPDTDIEYPTYNPDYQQFLNHYDSERDYLVLQMHPNSWDNKQFDQFKQVIEFLIQEDVTFITPFEYYQLLNRKNCLAPAYDYPWTDDFKSSSLDPLWSWMNEDASQWSLIAYPRYILRIMTHSGGVGDKNLLLRSVPTGDFEIRTRVIFTPTNNFQIAGLVLYQGNDYLMLGRAYCDTPPPTCVGNGIYFNRVEGGSFVGSNFATSTTTQGEVYLRVIREGTTYSGFYSEDGTSWTLIGRHTPSGAIPLSRVGLTAAQGTPEIPADFNCFRLDANYRKVFLPLVVKNY